MQAETRALLFCMDVDDHGKNGEIDQIAEVDKLFSFAINNTNITLKGRK
jgi:hypothetical protein